MSETAMNPLLSIWAYPWREAIATIKGELVPRMNEIASDRGLVTQGTNVTWEITTPGFESKARGYLESLNRRRCEIRHRMPIRPGLASPRGRSPLAETVHVHIEDSVAGIPVFKAMERLRETDGIGILRCVVESRNTTDEVRAWADVRFGGVELLAHWLRGLVHRLVVEGRLPSTSLHDVDVAAYRGSLFGGARRGPASPGHATSPAGEPCVPSDRVADGLG